MIPPVTQIRRRANNTHFIIVTLRGAVTIQGVAVTKWPDKTRWMSKRREGGKQIQKHIKTIGIF